MRVLLRCGVGRRRGWRGRGQANSGDGPEGIVRLSVAGPVEPVTGGPAGGCRDGAETAEGGEAGLGPDPLGAVPGGDEELRGDVAADAELGGQAGGSEVDELVEVAGDRVDLLGEGQPAVGSYIWLWRWRIRRTSIGGAEVQYAVWRPVSPKVSPTASPISTGLGGSQWVWMGRKPLVLLEFPHGREGGKLSRNA